MVVAALDAARYLGDALFSLTRQGISPDELEVLVVDDGSTDETAEVAAESSTLLPGLRVLRHVTTQGLSASRNHALAEARGEHLAFLDADDWLLPGTLGAALTTRNRLDVDFVAIDELFVTGVDRVPRRVPENRREVRLAPHDSILPVHRTTMVNYPNVVARVCHRRLLDAGLLSFDESLRTAEDRPWSWRLQLRASSFAVSGGPGAYAYRRDVPGSLTRLTDARQLDFLPAYRSIVAMLTDDAAPGVARFYPKAVRDLLVILTHHAGRARALDRGNRAALERGARDLVSSLDAGVVSAQLHAIGAERAAILRTIGIGDVR